MEINRQDGEVWIDGEGQEVPRKYVSDWQRLEEKKVHSIYREFTACRERVIRHKRLIVKHAEELIKEYYKNYKLDQKQQSFTFYNFTKEIQFEIDTARNSDSENGTQKIYYRIRVKDPETKNYNLIDPNFSSIELIDQ